MIVQWYVALQCEGCVVRSVQYAVLRSVQCAVFWPPSEKHNIGSVFHTTFLSPLQPALCTPVSLEAKHSHTAQIPCVALGRKSELVAGLSCLEKNKKMHYIGHNFLYFSSCSRKVTENGGIFLAPFVLHIMLRPEKRPENRSVLGNIFCTCLLL